MTITTSRTPGRFVVFEGGEGSGKTTAMQHVAVHLDALSIPVTTTREPGGTPLAEAVRDLLLNATEDTPRSRTEALLFAAARAQHVATVIAPALADGTWVLCDRFVASSVVYQGHVRGLGRDDVAALSQFATGGVTPDLTILLDVDATTGLSRAARTSSPDRIEAEGIAFHHKVNAAYRDAVAESDAPYVTIDANRPTPDVLIDVLNAVSRIALTPAPI